MGRKGLESGAGRATNWACVPAKELYLDLEGQGASNWVSGLLGPSVVLPVI